MCDTLTWLLNKDGENAEGHLHGLLQTLITNLTWFGGFPRDAIDQVSEDMQGLLYDRFHCRTTGDREESGWDEQRQSQQWSGQARKKPHILTAVEISLPRRNVHHPPKEAIFPSECCHQVAVAGGAGLPLLLILWQIWPWEQQHVGQSPAHQYVSLWEKAQGKCGFKYQMRLILLWNVNSKNKAPFPPTQ